MTTATDFRVQFSVEQAADLVAAYKADEKEMKREVEAMHAGERIASGAYSLANLMPIVRWKSPRPTSLVRSNDESDVADALRLAVIAETDRAAVAVLLGLRGVQVPVASAILTAIFSERYTIVDYRALEALGVAKSTITVEFYLAYLRHCRFMATKFELSLRDFDRALWKWSKERPGGVGSA